MGSPTPTPMESGQACLWVRFRGGGAAGLLGSHLITGTVWPENQRALLLPAGSVGSSRRWFWNPDPARVDEVLLSPHLEAGKSGISLGVLAIRPWGSLRGFWKAGLHFLPPPLPCHGSQGRAFAQGLMHSFPGWLPEPRPSRDAGKPLQPHLDILSLREEQPSLSHLASVPWHRWTKCFGCWGQSNGP